LDAGRKRLAATARSRSPSPFDAERMADTPAAAGSGHSSAPFDIERDVISARAA